MIGCDRVFVQRKTGSSLIEGRGSDKWADKASVIVVVPSQFSMYQEVSRLFCGRLLFDGVVRGLSNFRLTAVQWEAV